MDKRQDHIILCFILFITVSSATKASNEPLPIKKPKRGILSCLFCCGQTPEPEKETKPLYNLVAVKKATKPLDTVAAVKKETKPLYTVAALKLSPASAMQPRITKRYSDREHIRALVVDDVFSARRMIERYCQTVGIMNVDIAQSGEEAIEYAAKTSYSIIFMDTNLGTGIDGIKATAEIVKSSASKPPIIVSSNAQSLEDLAKNNMDDSFPKPFNKKLFGTLIDRHFKSKNRTSSL